MPMPGLDTEFDIPYVIICNSIQDNPATIYATGILPQRFTPFPDNIFATVRRIAFSREKYAPLFWRAVVHYSSVPLTEKEEQQAQSPLDRPAEIDWEATPYQVPVYFGTGYKANNVTIPPTYYPVVVPILNSAGDMPDPIPEKTEYYWVANVTKNMAKVPTWVLDDYSGAINAASYTIDGLTVQAECSRLIQLRISKKLKENDVRYRTLSFSLEFRGRRPVRTDANGAPLVVATREGGTGITLPIVDAPPPPFNLELADMGLHKNIEVYVAGQGFIKKKTKFLTDDTPPRPVAQPVLMDGKGDKLADPTPFNAVFGNWRILKSKDFTVLPLT